MLNIEEINNTIEELENGNTTFDNCLKLASLYIVRQNIKNANLTPNFNEISHEYADILPQYHRYVEIKRKYQLGELTERAVENSIGGVCKEIYEFIHTLYSCTDMPVERDSIKDMISKLTTL